jgi:hypothetical protein
MLALSTTSSAPFLSIFSSALLASSFCTREPLQQRKKWGLSLVLAVFIPLFALSHLACPYFLILVWLILVGIFCFIYYLLRITDLSVYLAGLMLIFLGLTYAINGITKFQLAQKFTVSIYRY